MKSAHRHELQTNALAQRLDVLIERWRPYASTIAGVILALVALMFVWSFVSRSSTARQGAAWDAYHRAITSRPPDLNQLHQSAAEYPGSKMQQLSDITWADGQVYMAARDYLYNRSAAMDALRRATSAYQGILQTTDDQRLVNRARLGLARVYEMQNELDKARDEYLKVQGGYAEFAKLQAERLAKPETKEAYAWLATANPPRPTAPTGPGTPGQRPDFSAGDFPLPGATPDASTPNTGSPAGTSSQGESFDDIIRRLNLNHPAADAADRYDAGAEPATTSDEPATSDSETEPPASEESPE